MEVSTGTSYSISVRVTEFDIPPVSDGLVLGKASLIGFTAHQQGPGLL